MLRDAIASGHVIHRRRSPVEHSFRYRVFYVCADVDKLERLPTARMPPVSLRAGDLANDDGSVRREIESRLAAKGHTAKIERIFAVAQPRMWGLFYNPVVFYICESAGQIAYLLAEVHNTPWGEKHTYVVETQSATASSGALRIPKQLHVSPFAPLDVDYEWRLEVTEKCIRIAIRLLNEGVESLFTGLYLATAPLTEQDLVRAAGRYPAQNLTTLTRIYWNALRLWRKRARFYPHPHKSPA